MILRYQVLVFQGFAPRTSHLQEVGTGTGNESTPLKRPSPHNKGEVGGQAEPGRQERQERHVGSSKLNDP